MSDVEILAPDPKTGQMLPASVPEADLPAAIAAGATKAPVEQEFGGGLGQATAAVFGAGRTASGGIMDPALIAGAGLLGGDDAARDMRHGLNVAKADNPYATMGGEAAGLFVGAGEGVTGAGNVAEEVASHALGPGLLGKIGSMGVRGATEGALLGQQHQISEDALGDVDYNGEKVFGAAAKDALLGGVIGGGLGALGHFGGQAIAGLRTMRGPKPAGLLDEVAGVDGAGRLLREDAAASQSLIGELQRTGATSEQAAVLADEVSTIARARTAGGPLSGLVDGAAERFAASRAGGNAEMREVLTKGYSDRAMRLANQEGILDGAARKLADKGTRVMRDMEDVVNDAQFTQKADHMAKLTDPSKWEIARDASLKSLQDADAVLSGLEQTASKGGQKGAVRNLRKQLTDFYAANTRIAEGITGEASENATRDFFMKMDALKRSADRFAGHGTSIFGRSEASHEFRALADRLRGTLEDEAIWGPAGAAQRESNATFSLAKGRRDDFGRRFAVSVDQVSGVPVPELDAGKIKSALRNLGGAEGDQAVKTTEAFIDGLRARTDAIEKHYSLSAEQSAKLTRGKAALDEFAGQFADSRKEAAVIARLRTQQLQEQGHGLGGILGLATDLMTKPLTTMERLGALKASTDHFEKGIANGIERFFGGKSAELKEAVAKTMSRPKDVVSKEIGELRQLAANPAAMQQRVGNLIGDTSSYAPKIAGSTSVVALRALTYLATQAPPSRADVSIGSSKPILRFSDQQLVKYENQRNAAFSPETVVAQMHAGKLNRDGIRTVKAVYPQLFASMQDTARTQIMKLEQEGKLDAMPYQQKAALATLLDVAADGTWKPDFIALMQSTKVPPPAPPQPGQAPRGSGGTKKLDTAAFTTGAQEIEGRTTE